MLNRLKFILITALPSLLFFFFIIPNADAATTYTIYAYGSGYIMTGILQSIASVVASGGFSLILKSVVLIGFVIIFLQMIITSFKVSPHRSLLKYFSAVLVIYSALLIPKVNVSVYDTVNNTTSNAVVVNNVPWGIGAIASYFSEFQYYMTTNIEQAFSTPNTIDLTNAGMGFALTSQNIVSGVQIDDPYLFQSFTQYVYNCVLPGVSHGDLSSQALTQAGMSTTGTGNATNSLLSYMASYTSGAGANLITTEYSAAGGDGSPSGTTTTCGAQTSDIQTDFTNYATNEAGPQIAGALGMTYANFASNYGLVNNAIYSMSSNAMDEIIQMMAVNQFNQAMIQSANLAGVDPSQLAYGSALAQQNMSDSFSISGQMAGKYMPVVYGIFSALFLAFSLFLIILMALPIGVNYLKMYMELGLFLAVWPTLMAVYNYIIDLIIQQQFGYMATQGYSLNSAHTVNTFIATQLGWMGYLSWGVPMMAYALVTGSTYAMVGAISSMDSAGKKAAGAAAAQAASGSVNLGNDSMNNYNANKANSVADVSTGMRRNYYDSSLKDTSNKTLSGTSSVVDNSHKNISGTSSVDDNTNRNLNGKISTTDYTAKTTAQTNENPKLAGGLLSKGLGIASDNGMTGTVTEGAGVTDFKGMINRKGLSSLIAGGKLGGQALTEAKQALSSGKSEFYMDAQGANGHIAKLGIGNEQNVAMVTNGSMGNILTKKIGIDTQNGNFKKIGNYKQIYHDATSLQVGDTAIGSVIMQAAMGNKKDFAELQKLSKGHPQLRAAIAKDYMSDVNLIGQKKVSSGHKKAVTKKADRSTKIDHNTMAGWEASLNTWAPIVIGGAAVGVTELATDGLGTPAAGAIYGGTALGVDYAIGGIEGKLGLNFKYSKNKSFDRSHNVGSGSSASTNSGTDISSNVSSIGAYKDFLNGTPYSLPTPNAVSIPKGTFKPLNNPLSLGGLAKDASSKIFHGVGIDPMNIQNGAYSGEYIPPAPAGGAAGSPGGSPLLQGGGTPQIGYNPQIGYEAGEAGQLLLP